MRRLTIEQARRIALGAQGFAEPRPTGVVNVRHFRRVVAHTRVVQLDSVNVVARAHYLPFFSRLGAYSMAALDRWLWESGEMFEYWAHVASIVPVEQRPLMRHRMERVRRWGPNDPFEQMRVARPDYLNEVLELVRERGPVRISDLESGARRGDGWWGWSEGRMALEYLFLGGQIAAAGRQNFMRLYDVPERVFEADVLETPGLDEHDAQLELLALGAQALGVGTDSDIADYYRIKVTQARTLLPELVARGDLERVEVPGWREATYVHRDAVLPRRIEAQALFTPFDPVVWRRERAVRLFGFEYKISIYTPKAQRAHGYYVLPFLHNDRLVARVDLKADRQAKQLLVRGAFAEADVDRASAGAALLDELETMAGWLGLDEVVIEPNGDLAPFL